MIDVKDFHLHKGINASELISQMQDSGGFSAKHLATARGILQDMEKEKDCLRILSFPACITSTGTRGIIRDFLKHKMFDLVITTCGTWDHDLARSHKKYYHGHFGMDDRELYKKGINRLGNVLVPNDSYGIIIEKKMRPILERIEKSGKQAISTNEFSWEIGKTLGEDSILYWAEKNKIPVIVPAPTDGSVGYQFWQYAQGKKMNFDLMKDESLLADYVFDHKK